MTLNFTDGVKIETSGPLRPLKLSDGWYVCGEGKLIPVDSSIKAKELIDELNKKSN